MIKMSGTVLQFKVVSKNGDIFPKDCKIDIPDKIPLLLDFDRNNPIGFCIVSRNEDSLSGVAEIMSDKEELIKEIRTMEVGGYYDKLKYHKENEILTVDECRLKAVSLVYASAQPGCSFSIKEE